MSNQSSTTTKPILASSKGTFEWYLNNLVRLGFYGLSKEDWDKLNNALGDISNILDSLEVKADEDLSEV